MNVCQYSTQPVWFETNSRPRRSRVATVSVCEDGLSFYIPHISKQQPWCPAQLATKVGARPNRNLQWRAYSKMGTTRLSLPCFFERRNAIFSCHVISYHVTSNTLQMATQCNKVNGSLCTSTYLDGLEDVVSQDGYRDAETFDICFRYALFCLDWG